MSTSPTGTTSTAYGHNRLIRDFSQDIVPGREDDEAPRPLRNGRASIQSPKTRRRLKEEDSWLDEIPAQPPQVPRKRSSSIEYILQNDPIIEAQNEPLMEGPLDVPASAAPRSLSPHPVQRFQGMNYDEEAHLSATGLKQSRSPQAAEKFQGFVFEADPRQSSMEPQQQQQQQQQLLSYAGDRTIKKSLGREDAESIANTEASTASSSRLANFFGLEVFQIVLHNPTTSHQLTKFCQSRFCSENMTFLERVDRYNALIDELGTTMLDIHKNFISVNAQTQINLPNSVMTKINKDLKSTLGNALPKMELIFASAQTSTEDLIFSDIYPRFVRHQLVVSATKALASDRSKYAGLGDCFVLTNPAKADNPIVFASDGFVNVTGYSRRDIIPRNCRFLQGRQTDKQAVGRLRMSLDNREESVELLLNYKKNKEPFWNLLYTAPLYDENGNVAFFIGGQINCSTTIHNASDILRVLSYSDDVDDKQEKAMEPAPAPSRKSTFGRSFFKSLRGDTLAEINGNKDIGMENAVLNKIDNMTIKKQMESFHSAYSKYIVINYDTMAINYFSMSIIDILYGTRPLIGQVVGINIFTFLGEHAVNIGRDFKSRVKTSLKAGKPISLDLNLSTRKFMRYVHFVTHWTPLKDDDGKVCYVVLALGSSQV